MHSSQMCLKASKEKDKEIDYSLRTLHYTVLIEESSILSDICESMKFILDLISDYIQLLIIYFDIYINYFNCI